MPGWNVSISQGWQENLHPRSVGLAQRILHSNRSVNTKITSLANNANTASHNWRYFSAWAKLRLKGGNMRQDPLTHAIDTTIAVGTQIIESFIPGKR